MSQKEALRSYVARVISAGKKCLEEGKNREAQILRDNAYGAVQAAEIMGVIDRSEFMALEMEIFGSQS